MTDEQQPKRRPRTTHAPDSRFPPQNLDAEEAALGAALLSTEAARQLVELVRPEDFYRPAHQHIADAFTKMVKAGDDKVDNVTVAEQLRRDGLLEDVGGPQYLLELQNATPAISNAAKYLRIVKDTATARRVIATGAEISELGYHAGQDAAGAVVRAVDLLGRLTASTTTAAPRLFTQLSGAEEGEQESPTFLARQDGAFLLYHGRENALQGEPASGKTWVALIAVKEILAIGGTVILLDLEDTATTARARLRALGVTVEQLERVFHTDGRELDTGRELTMSELAAALSRSSPDVVVIDSIAEAFTRWQLDEDKAADANQFRDAVVKPLTRTGTTVITLDHVAKSTEQRGRYARGSGAKLSGLDGAAYGVSSTGFNRTTGGRIVLKVAKDRPGGLPGIIGETVAQVWMPPAVEGHAIRYAIDVPPPPATKADRTAETTVADHDAAITYRTEALALLDELGPLSKRTVLDTIRGRRQTERRPSLGDPKAKAVLAELVASGAVVEVGTGSRQAIALPPQQQALELPEDRAR